MPDIPEDLDLEEVLACVAEGASQITYELAIIANWLLDLNVIVVDLVEQRRRCNAMTSERLQQLCIYNWTISVLFNANSLRNDLARLTDPETAELFRYHFLDCFGVVDPDA